MAAVTSYSSGYSGERRGSGCKSRWAGNRERGEAAAVTHNRHFVEAPG